MNNRYISYISLLFLFQAVFRQDTMEMLRLGHKMVIVFTVETLKTGEVILEVLSVTPRSLNIIPDLEFECPPIEKLFRDRRQSPWSFVISLAYMAGVLAAPRLYEELVELLQVSALFIVEDIICI